MTTTFIPGLELARLFYHEAVRPLLDTHVPGLPHTAALIGPGSEVLRFDTPRSTDHDWGPRLQLFLADEAASGATAAQVSALLAARLPASFRGYPTAFAWSGRPGRRPAHHVLVAGLRSWLTGWLGFDPLVPITLADWLAVPTQRLAEFTGGAVFHDGLAAAGTIGLEELRARLRWYPHDLWLHVMACQWQRIGQEEPFPGRCAEVGDDLGSIVITARLARDLMRLALLMQRRYPPYSKWLGTALARTPAGAELRLLLSAALSASTWRDRERGLSRAYESVARLHNAIGVTPWLDPAIRPTFYDRPVQIPDAGRFVRALRDRIQDDAVRSLPLTGAVDQFIDSTDALGDLDLCRAATQPQLPQPVSGTGRPPTAA